MVPTPTPALAAMSRTGTSTPDVTKAEAAASSSVFSLRRASARFRGADDPLSTSTTARYLRHSTGHTEQCSVCWLAEHCSTCPGCHNPACRTRCWKDQPPMPPSFGIMTAPSQVDYHDVLQVWRDADAIPQIEH